MSVVHMYTTDRFGYIPKVGEIYEMAPHGMMVCREVTKLKGERYAIRAAILPPRGRRKVRSVL